MIIFLISVSSLPAKLTYTLNFQNRNRHVIDVDLDVDGLRKRDHLDVKMATWAPGSYKIRDFSGNVVKLEAVSAGKLMPVEKLDKTTWRVTLNGNRSVIIRYQVYAFQQTVRGSYVDSDGAMLNAPSVFICPVGMEKQEALVVLNLPRGWQTATAALPWVGGNSPVFRSHNFYRLLDTPIMAGSHSVFDFEIDSIPFKLAVQGKGKYDRTQLISHIKAIGGQIHTMFGTIPYENYTIFMQLKERRGGGMEHANSTHIIVSRWSFQETEDYQKTLELIAHEMFHAYNVKRIKPIGLNDIDIATENYTKSLWIAEGTTSYYDRLLLLRAGIIDEQRYLELLSEDIEKLLNTPGRLVQPLADASFDAWIKFYKPTPDSDNNSISYYLKGSLVSLALDLAIRDATAGEASLDDVFHQLWADHNGGLEGYTPEYFRSITDSIAGRPLDDIWKYVSTTVEMDWDALLAPVGYRLEVPAAEDNTSAYFGFEYEFEGGRMMISRIVHGGPMASYRVSVGDELVFVDNYRVTPKNVETLLESRTQNKIANFVVNRNGYMRTYKVRPETPPHDPVKIVPIDEPTELQSAIYSGWLNLVQD